MLLASGTVFRFLPIPILELRVRYDGKVDNSACELKFIDKQGRVWRTKSVPYQNGPSEMLTRYYIVRKGDKSDAGESFEIETFAISRAISR